MTTRTIVVTVPSHLAEIVTDRMWQWGVQAVSETGRRGRPDRDRDVGRQRLRRDRAVDGDARSRVARRCARRRRLDRPGRSRVPVTHVVRRRNGHRSRFVAAVRTRRRADTRDGDRPRERIRPRRPSDDTHCDGTPRRLLHGADAVPCRLAARRRLRYGSPRGARRATRRPRDPCDRHRRRGGRGDTTEHGAERRRRTRSTSTPHPLHRSRGPTTSWSRTSWLPC